MVNHVYLTAATKCIHEVAGNVNITLVPWAMSVFNASKKSPFPVVSTSIIKVFLQHAMIENYVNTYQIIIHSFVLHRLCHFLPHVKFKE